jgi:hypothetical protein
MTELRNLRRVVTLLLLTLIALPLHADFSSIARAIDAQHGVSRVWIPFLGIARVAVIMVAPEGIHDFQLVTFEGADNVDPHKLHDIIRTQAGLGFSPLVQTWSRHSNEWSFIYAKPSRHTNRLELIVLVHDHEETVLVRVEVDADKVAREVRKQPREVSHVARR